MHAIESLNKALGILFAIFLVAFAGYRAHQWRNDIHKEAGRRFEKRIQAMSEDPRYQLPKSEYKWPEVKLSPEDLQGFSFQKRDR